MHRVIIIGCGKAKGPHRAPARELYVGSLFRAARHHAEASTAPWLILSALHWIVEPDDLLDPYDHTGRITPADAERALRAAAYFALGVPPDRRPTISERSRRAQGGPITIEVHAGARYAQPLAAAGARIRGIVVQCPLAGLQVGERLAWYAARRAAVAGEQLDLLGEVA